MENCGTCKHWKNADDPDSDPRYGKCEAIPHGKGIWDNECNYLVYEGDNLALAVDAESYSAWLETQRNFGCVLHEPLLPPE